MRTRVAGHNVKTGSLPDRHPPPGPRDSICALGFQRGVVMAKHQTCPTRREIQQELATAIEHELAIRSALAAVPDGSSLAEKVLKDSLAAAQYRVDDVTRRAVNHAVDCPMCSERFKAA
jgi:hypothetical protein